MCYLLAGNPLPIDISDALKHGIAGLGAVMATLCFALLYVEQKKTTPRRVILTAIYIFMVFSFLLVLIGMISSPEAVKAIGDLRAGYTVPHADKKKVDSLPKETSSGEYILYKDISIFDLRGWKPVPEDKKNVEISPANYINYLHIKKIKKLDSIVIHYATSGYDIDIRCITHGYKLYEANTNTTEHKGDKSYGISIDVSSVPLNEEFLVVIEATYWNGFGDPTKEDASTYTDNEITGLNELDLIVLLPFDKPVKDTHRSVGHEGSYTEYRETDKFYIDQNKKFVYWGIKDIRANRHYKLNWTW